MEENKHPAFGLVKFSKVMGHPGHLFGSSVECENYVELEISHAVESIDTGLDRHYHHDGAPIVTVAMTPAQFAELITTMNIGSGIPCTIRDIDGKGVERIPDNAHEHELDRQRRQFKEKMMNLSKELHTSQKRIEELLKQPRLNKEEKEELAKVLYKGTQDIDSNIPYFMSFFDEATDKIVQEAKSEIDAVVHDCVINAGIKALGEEFKNYDQIDTVDNQKLIG